MTDQDIIDIMQLIHHEWSKAETILASVKEAEKDPSEPDWEEFQKFRLNNANVTVLHWKRLRDKYLDENRETLNRVYGLS